MTQDGAVFGQSDAGAHVAQLCDANMPTELLAHWVRDGGEFTLEHAIHKLTAELADLFELHDRGRIAEGAAADIVVFDLETVDPGPLRRVRDLPGDEERLIAEEPTGVEHVLVNGVAITQPRRVARDHHDRATGHGAAGARRGRVMRAVVCYVPGDIRVEDIDEPTPGAGEVKVKIGAVGVCHTDLNYFLGAVPVPYADRARPRGRGRRRRGRARGRGARGRRPRDLLDHRARASTASNACATTPGLCENAPFFTGKMLDGTTRLSKAGEPIHTLHYQGSYAEYAVVPERFVVPIPRRRPARRRVRPRVRRQHRPRRRDRARARCNPARASSSIGAGGVGLSTMMGARFAGATTVDRRRPSWRRRSRRRSSSGFATHGIDASTTDAVEARPGADRRPRCRLRLRRGGRPRHPRAGDRGDARRARPAS